MTNISPEPQRVSLPFLSRFSLDSWSVALATALVVLIVAGILPRVPW